MSLTIELSPEAEHAVAEEAQRLGVPAETFAANLVSAWVEDAEDIAAADRVTADSDSSKRVPWTRIKAELGL